MKGHGMSDEYPRDSAAVLVRNEVWDLCEPCDCGCEDHVRVARSIQRGWESTPAVPVDDVYPLTPFASELLRAARKGAR